MSITERQNQMQKAVVCFCVMMVLAGIDFAAEAGDNPDTLRTPGPGTYEILGEVDTPIRIPFRLHHGKPLMDLAINGKQAFHPVCGADFGCFP